MAGGRSGAGCGRGTKAAKMAAIMTKAAKMAKVANVATFFAAGLEEGAGKGAKCANVATFFRPAF